MAQSRREQLQNLLETILGTKNVYFQPPEGLNISYPAIVYNLESVATDFASDRPYKLHDRYQIQYIDRSPISAVPRKIQELPMTRFTSHFVTDGLNHYNHVTYF